MVNDITRRELQLQRQLARERFAIAERLENRYRRQLQYVAENVGQIVRGFAPKGRVENPALLDTTLRQYAVTIRPWATAVSARMQSEVDRKDVQAWEKLAQAMGTSLRKEVEHAPTGAILRVKLSEQIESITSIPREAADRVRRLTVRLLSESGRAKEIEDDILRSGTVARHHAKTIARTQVSSTASMLTESRAIFIGSPGYIWRTSGDSDVRPFHKKLNGKFIPWGEPPIVDEKGRRAHAGQDFNCRCYPEPTLPDVIQ